MKTHTTQLVDTLSEYNIRGREYEMAEQFLPGMESSEAGPSGRICTLEQKHKGTVKGQRRDKGFSNGNYIYYLELF